MSNRMALRALVAFCRKQQGLRCQIHLILFLFFIDLFFLNFGSTESALWHTGLFSSWGVDFVAPWQVGS